MTVVFYSPVSGGFDQFIPNNWLLRDYELILVLTTIGPTVGPKTLNKNA